LLRPGQALILEEKLPRLFSDGDKETLKMYHMFVKVRTWHAHA
jgi:hypothetical protein